MATMYTVFGGTLLNIGVTFSNQGSQLVANGSFVGAGMGKHTVVHTVSVICCGGLNVFFFFLFWCRDIHVIGSEIYAKGK